MRAENYFSPIALEAQSLLRSHITDSLFFGDGYGTDEVKKIFSDFSRLQRWMDVEIALAKTQADLNIIPVSAANEIERKGKVSYLNVEYIQQQIQKTKHSLIPLLKAWQSIMSSESGDYLHFGATTQDIQDTAQVLELREVINIVERDLKEIIKILAKLAKKYSSLVMVGRTHAKHAMPVTLGLKIAIWLDECMRNYDRLMQCKKTILVSQLFGGVGTMAAFQDKGAVLLKNFSKKLGLETPNTCWHSARDRFVEYLSVLAFITGSFAKIANEIIQLSKDEIGELDEPFYEGQIGSTTMPHKKNPEICERIFTLAKLVKGHASLSFDSLIAEHERDYRAVRLEWVTLTDASLYTCCALKLMKSVLQGLVVNKNNIIKNLEKSSDILSSEAIRFSLSKKLDKKNAFDYVYKASIQSLNKKTSLIKELMSFDKIKEQFTESALNEIANPSKYIGSSVLMSNNMVCKSIEKFELSQDISVKYIGQKTLIITYKDPLEKFEGWLVFDGLDHGLSAGGMRVQKGLTQFALQSMAENMTKKMRLCGLPVNGAKSGIDYDPASFDKKLAIGRFIKAIAPFIQSRYSMGSDLNTTMEELTQIAIAQGIPSVKIAIAKEQNYTLDYFHARESILNKMAIQNWSLGRIRAGYVVAMCAARLRHHLHLEANKSKISIQGFGVLAKATIVGLLQEGYSIHAISDAHCCVVSTQSKGLPVQQWLQTSGNTLPKLSSTKDYWVLDREALVQQPTDLLILAAIENAVHIDNVDFVQAKAIVPGANLAVTPDAEKILNQRNILVLPSFVAGSGGSMSMQALFGYKNHPSTEQVLNYMRKKTFSLVDELMLFSQKYRITLTEASEKYIHEKKIPYAEKPYEIEEEM